MDLVARLVQRHHAYALGQRRHELAPVPLRADSRVEHHDPPRVGRGPDQPPDALLEPDHRPRDLVLPEGVAPPLLDALETRLESRGYPAMGEAMPLRLPPYGRFEALNVSTPDGALIQFIERSAAPW